MTGEELPRLAGLEGFELWDRTVHAPEHKEVKVAFVSVRVGGVIGLNRAAFKMWGEPGGYVRIHATPSTEEEPCSSRSMPIRCSTRTT